MIPQLMQSFGINATEVGFLTTAFFYSYIVMQIPSGILIDLFGPKVILSIGCFAAATACMIFSTCHEVWMAKSSRILMGLTCAPGIVATLTLAASWFKEQRFALVAGLTETLSMMGAAMGSVLLAYSVHLFGWRKSIFGCGLIGYALFLIIILGVKNLPKAQSIRSSNLHHFSVREEIKKLGLVFKLPQAWIAGLFSGLMFSLFPALFALWGVPFFMDRYQIPSTHAALLVSFGYLGAALGGPIVGALSSYLKRRKILMVAGSFLTCLFFLALLIFELSFTGSAVLLFCLGFTVGSYILAFAFVSDLCPIEVKGKSMGFTNTLTLLIGAPILQPLIGSRLAPLDNPLTKCLYDFKNALMVIAVALILAFILSLFLKETYCSNPDPK